MMTAHIENGEKFLKEALEMSQRRADIEQWFKAQSDAVFQQNTSDLKQPEAIWHEEVFERNRQRWDDLQTEHEKRRKDAGLTDHEKKVDAVLDDIEAGLHCPLRIHNYGHIPFLFKRARLLSVQRTMMLAPSKRHRER
jgi:hypothetical protein